MTKEEEEDLARAAVDAAIIHSSKDDNNNGSSSSSQLQRLQYQVTKLFKGFSSVQNENTNYNPEILTALKRQWAANFHLKYMVSCFANCFSMGCIFYCYCFLHSLL
jgi:hypothetical protein